MHSHHLNFSYFLPHLCVRDHLFEFTDELINIAGQFANDGLFDDVIAVVFDIDWEVA